MFPPARSRHLVRSTAVLAAFGLAPLLISCSSSDSPAPGAESSIQETGTTSAGTMSDQERLAQAKTVAVAYFQAQAINDYGRARERSSDAASQAIDWAEGVNSIDAAKDSGYQVPSVDSPNVRVQIDALTAGSGDVWTADGFVELSFRPGPVASTTTTTTDRENTETTVEDSPSTYIVDLTFEGDGDAMRIVDYRLDDLPYPVSQLFMAIDTPTEQVDDVKGRTVLGHRDFDGSVQYLVQLEADAASDRDPATWVSSFTPAPEGTPPGTAVLPLGPDTVDGEIYADPLTDPATTSALVVFPGAFPGTAGTLTLALTGTTAATSSTTAPSGTVPTTEMNWALPPFAELTPRPVNTVEPTTASSSTTSSTTTTTEPDESTTTTSTTTDSSVVPPVTESPTTSSTTTSSTTTTSTTRPA